LLPFLRKKQEEGSSPTLSIKTRTPDKKEDSDDAGLNACAQDLLDAVQARDVSGVAAALKAAFEIADSQPHEEGPHTYEDQKE
jgi:hypothetical protein